MDALTRVYWPPVYAWLRRSGRNRDEAEELTQSFFGRAVLERGLLDGAAPEKGRLRSLMLAALRNHVVDQHRRESVRDTKRIAAAAFLDEDCRTEEGMDADEVFRRRWRVAVMEEAMRRCEQHYVGIGKAGHWRIFESRVLRPLVGSVEATRLDAGAEIEGFRTPALASAAVQTVKRRLESLVQEVVRETLPEGGDVAEELAQLRAGAVGVR